MYVNKCSKCGAEFETKNPKRVICPSCLYPDRKPILNSISPTTEQAHEPETPAKVQPEQPQQGDRPQGDRFKGKEDLNFKLKKLRKKFN